MRQIDRAPLASLKSGGRAGAHARIGQLLAQAPIVAQMEFPAKIHQQPFARERVGCGELMDIAARIKSASQCSLVGSGRCEFIVLRKNESRAEPQSAQRRHFLLFFSADSAALREKSAE